ncbi:PepSY domain-containing protein [Clostridium sp. AUH-JLR23]|uniref:PepSY domain-containing protein n=1 Tax=Clostridium sp. AUH-JLR23 TaxID=1505062 RepID=UPI00356A44B0
MKNKDIKRKIKEEFQDIHMPSKKEKLLEDIQFVQPIQEDKHKNKHFNIKWQLSILTIACICIFSFITLQTQDAYSISFEVNPSIELKVNNQRRVDDVICHNDDAVLVLDDMDLKNTDLDVAVNAVIGSMFKHGYISEAKNSVLVSVQGSDQEKRNALKQDVATDVKDILSGYSLEASVVSQDYDFSKEREALAKQYGISVGKVTLIQKLINVSPNYDFEDLIHLSINDLNTLIHYKHLNFKSITIDGVESHSGYLTNEQVKSKVLQHAHVNEESVYEYRDDLDVQDNQLIYIVEFTDEFAKYHYKVNAISGEIVSFESEM